MLVVLTRGAAALLYTELQNHDPDSFIFRSFSFFFRSLRLIRIRNSRTFMRVMGTEVGITRPGFVLAGAWPRALSSPAACNQRTGETRRGLDCCDSSYQHLLQALFTVHSGFLHLFFFGLHHSHPLHSPPLHSFVPSAVAVTIRIADSSSAPAVLPVCHQPVASRSRSLTSLGAVSLLPNLRNKSHSCPTATSGASPSQ